MGGWASRRVDDATFANVLMLNLSSYRQPEGGYPAWPNTHRRLLLLSPQLGLDPVSSPRLPLLPPSATRTSLGRPRDPFNLHLILDSTVRPFISNSVHLLLMSVLPVCTALHLITLCVWHLLPSNTYYCPQLGLASGNK